MPNHADIVTVCFCHKKKKSLILILNKQMGDNHFSVTLYLKSDHLDKLYSALENARTGHLR